MVYSPNFAVQVKKNRERRQREAERKGERQKPAPSRGQHDAKLTQNWTAAGLQNSGSGEDQEQEASRSDSGEEDEEDEEFSIISVVEGKNPRVVPRKLDLSSANSRRSAEVVIGMTRVSPRDDAARQRSQSGGSPEDTTTAVGQHGGRLHEGDDGSVLDPSVDVALEDLLRVTEELKKSQILEDEDGGDGGRGDHVDSSWRSGRRDRGQERNGVYIVTDSDSNVRGSSSSSSTSSTSRLTTSSEGVRHHRTSPRSRSVRQGEGLFGSPLVDLSDFEFLYTDKPTSTPVSPSGRSPPASSSSSAEGRKVSRSALTKLLLEE